MNIDVEKLRKDLMDYYGTAAVNGFPLAFMDVARVEKASAEELIGIAEDIGYDLRKYLC